MSNIVSPLGTYTLLMCVYVSGLRQVGMHWSDVQLGLPCKVFPGIARNSFLVPTFFFFYIFSFSSYILKIILIPRYFPYHSYMGEYYQSAVI